MLIDTLIGFAGDISCLVLLVYQGQKSLIQAVLKSDVALEKT